MNKRIFVSLIAFLLYVVTYAAIGDWRLHTSYYAANYCQIVKDRIFVLSNGSLYSYNYDDGEIRTYDKINTLSDTDISFISYCSKEDVLVILYKNANIDLLYSNDDVYNISDFKNSSIKNKNINNISIVDGYAYLSTNFGIVELDIVNKEFKNTFTLNKKVFDSYRFNGYIYTGTDAGLYRGKVTDNLLDISFWTKIEDYKVTDIQEYNNNLYYIVENSGVYNIDNNTPITESQVLGNSKEKSVISAPQYLYRNEGKLYAGSNNELVIFENSNKAVKYTLDGNSHYILSNGNTLWNCKGNQGLVKCSIKNSKITEENEGIVPNSPIRNYCEYMKFNGNKLLVAGGTLNPYDTQFYDGTLITYDSKSDYWTNFQEEEVKEQTPVHYKNMCCIVEDPNEEGHYFASSFGQGLYEFRNGEFIELHDSLSWSVNNLPNYIRIPRLKYDSKGNLWLVNTGTKNIVKVIKSDGSFQSLYYNLIEKKPTMVDILFDSRGWLWLSSLQSPAGIFCAKLNGTPFDTSDDKTNAWYSKFTNQDGTSYEIVNVYSIAEDRDGEIWLGTSSGLFVIKNPEIFFDDGVFTQIKIPRNDASGLADYLLNGVHIQSICIDGANRKWIGTANNGIYLVSADGEENIHHFTVENSPLPSNTITSIAINDNSGEVFIGTSKGIVSYMSDATEPEEELRKGSVHAYPNPVKPDYSGDIHIVGLTFNCNVKIVNGAGLLIYEGISNGGEFVWDGRDYKGKRVASGIYYVLAADENGKEGVATKIMVVR